MIAFILRRMLQSIAVLLAVGLVAFSLFRYVGDPINAMVGQDTSMEDRAMLREKLGLNDSPPVQFLRFVVERRARQFRPELPHLRAGRPHDLRARAGDPRARLLRRDLRAVRRRADGRLYRPLSKTLVEPAAADGVAARRVAAAVPDRHPADPDLRGHAALAAVLRPRPDGADRLVDHQLPHHLGPQGPDPAVDHARPVPAHADHAPGALGDAGGDAHRLHQVRAAPAGSPTAPSTSAMRSRTRWCR